MRKLELNSTLESFKTFQPPKRVVSSDSIDALKAPLNRKLECLKCVQPFKFIQVYSRVFKTFQDLNAFLGLFIDVENLKKLE